MVKFHRNQYMKYLLLFIKWIVLVFIICCHFENNIVGSIFSAVAYTRIMAKLHQTISWNL